MSSVHASIAAVRAAHPDALVLAFDKLGRPIDKDMARRGQEAAKQGKLVVFAVPAHLMPN